jgi:hypothetical protein
MNILLQQLSDEINARGYSQKTFCAYLAANEHLIRYFGLASIKLIFRDTAIETVQHRFIRH